MARAHCLGGLLPWRLGLVSISVCAYQYCDAASMWLPLVTNQHVIVAAGMHTVHCTGISLRVLVAATVV